MAPDGTSSRVQRDRANKDYCLCDFLTYCIASTDSCSVAQSKQNARRPHLLGEALVDAAYPRVTCEGRFGEKGPSWEVPKAEVPYVSKRRLDRWATLLTSSFSRESSGQRRRWTVAHRSEIEYQSIMIWSDLRDFFKE